MIVADFRLKILYVLFLKIRNVRLKKTVRKQRKVIRVLNGVMEIDNCAVKL